MEIIGQLTGGVAHDFNNLLQVIGANLDALRQRVLSKEIVPADIERLADAAIRGTERAAGLTRRLLAYSRQQPLDPKPVDVNRLVSGMSDLLRRTLGEAVSIETVPGAGVWLTLADTNELESVLLNLAINSRDAMPNGGNLKIATANISTESACEHEGLSPGEYVMITVTDTGTGMAKEVADRAFEPFFTTKEPGQGTGLGLSQVYGFVKQSGGNVILESEPNAGTTVKIFLPRLFSEEAADAKQSTVTPAELTSTKERTILIVEDDDGVREVTAIILRDLGYLVSEAGGAMAALKLIESDGTGFDLILSDIGLPGPLNGRQLADRVRLRLPEQKVLFTTGYERNTIVHDGRLDPGVDLITKPFSVTQLATKLREMFGGD